MVRKIFLVLSMIALLSLCSLNIAEGSSIPEPTITASSAILVDAESGQILWERNSHQKRPMASTTKIMTAILVLERTKLTDVVTTSQRASDVSEAELYLSPGEQRTIEELLYGLMLKSANDAAVALAEHASGDLPSFLELMNRKAKNIGALDTHFANPHGLNSHDHYSTAYDLALITRYAFKDPKFAQIVNTKEYTLPWPGNPYPRKLRNHNKLLWQYPYANGVKTGYTRQAGHCLVASATKNGVQLISVVLNSLSSQTMYEDSRKLLEYGFTHFKRERVVKKGEVYTKVDLPMWGDRKLNLVAAKDLVVQVKQEPHTLKKTISTEKFSLPVEKGQKLGEIRVEQSARELGRVELVAQNGVVEPTFLEKVFIWVKSLFKSLRNL